MEILISMFPVAVTLSGLVAFMMSGMKDRRQEQAARVPDHRNER